MDEIKIMSIKGYRPVQGDERNADTPPPACSADLQRQIHEVEAAIAPLQDRLFRLMGQKRKADSIAFIAANRITRDDVEMSNGKDKPWFGNVWTFAKWIKANRPDKLWAEWNGRIYHAADLIAGRMPDMPGCTDDLPPPGPTGRRRSDDRFESCRGRQCRERKFSQRF